MRMTPFVALEILIISACPLRTYFGNKKIGNTQNRTLLMYFLIMLEKKFLVNILSTVHFLVLLIMIMNMLY